MKIYFSACSAALLGSAALLALSLVSAQQASKSQAPPRDKRNAAAKSAQRKIPCKTSQNSQTCYWTRGRLSVYEGGPPSYRLWKIGTHRILGIFNGPLHFPPTLEEYDEIPELPAILDTAYEADSQRMKRATGFTWTIPPSVFADFEVCPLEPEKEGEMQAVCIESAKNIFIKPDD